MAAGNFDAAIAPDGWENSQSSTGASWFDHELIGPSQAAAATFALLTSAAAGSLPVTATVDSTFGGLTATSAGAVAIVAASTATFGDGVPPATGAVSVSAAADT